MHRGHDPGGAQGADAAVLEEIRDLAALGDVLADSPVAASELRAEHRLVEDLELDSIALITLAVEIENHFRIAFSEDDDASLRTVGDLARRVVALRQGRDGGG
ncbi:MAG: acyl carrier protein [Acidobacteria bacterium]|nr:MAG: acyl carrier protein [Acidobacteriota bacterium]REJ99585.1 MAG: acyl carrier protein [Acidobacteriota bacterium]